MSSNLFEIVFYGVFVVWSAYFSYRLILTPYWVDSRIGKPGKVLGKEYGEVSHRYVFYRVGGIFLLTFTFSSLFHIVKLLT